MNKETFYIKVVEQGPYLVYGTPVLDQQVIIANEEGLPWTYRLGNRYDPPVPEPGHPYALCRCGHSHSKPFCDGSHVKISWDGKETASHRPFEEECVAIEGPEYVLWDNEKYCSFARFCDAHGRIWNLVQVANDPKTSEWVRHEAAHCPSGRLVLIEQATGEKYEPPYKPRLSILENKLLSISGPIWVRGGIRIEGADGKSYEIRNRVTLCRCGLSRNKPFCDSTHVSSRFKDGLPSYDLGDEE